ncbi:hypothetical protein BN11_5040004 [Nostocoides australiense Ben110]|uniref:Uncharacterized protein n=1 Tax=Nostocoides australiense Ben110 TaxID=1193182 RepID=W6K4I8_9MICO|nr:hypothetical protein BN11_2800015 [Tetrasphaera australiensis Ben110]CCH75089.1 hypothetical protein BN11_5040004 [Tetrasphaera australiensis Ben110]
MGDRHRAIAHVASAATLSRQNLGVPGPETPQLVTGAAVRAAYRSACGVRELAASTPSRIPPPPGVRRG